MLVTICFSSNLVYNIFLFYTLNYYMYNMDNLALALLYLHTYILYIIIKIKKHFYAPYLIRDEMKKKEQLHEFFLNVLYTCM